jgi:hypothetical protein
MGYMQHHAIVVSSWQPGTAEAARQYAAAIGCTVTNIVMSPVNGYRCFLIAPDGSKLGLSHSDTGDEQRVKFITYARELYREGRYLEWAEVLYADEERGDILVNSSELDPGIQEIRRARG